MQGRGHHDIGTAELNDSSSFRNKPAEKVEKRSKKDVQKGEWVAHEYSPRRRKQGYCPVSVISSCNQAHYKPAILKQYLYSDTTQQCQR